MVFETSRNGRWTWTYKYPIVGTFAQAYDANQDAIKKERDFLRHTGRYYAYESDAYTSHVAGQMRGAIRELASTGRRVGRTVSNIMELD